MTHLNRRQHERFALSPMYTAVSIRLLDEPEFTRHGHAFDVSEGGLRFEMDEAVAPGTPVAIQIELPIPVTSPDQSTIESGRVRAIGNVIWCDTEEPGAARMALAITRFERAEDKQRLIGHLSSGRFLRAA